MKKNMPYNFDVIVIGGGHAGIEAAYAAARLGTKTLLLTMDHKAIGRMSCNPAIGGIGKGHIVFEVSALGGLMPQLCTQTYLQARMLNTSKGPAVQGLRLQIDKDAYSKLSQKILKKTDNLTIASGLAETFLMDGNMICGVMTANSTRYTAASIILTTGTFLKGRVYIGQDHYESGRHGELTATKLSQELKRLGLRMGRLKTGTPPRLLRSSLDLSVMEVQDAHSLNYLFEFYPHKTTTRHDCYITHTNVTTHEIIKNNLHRSAMYSGMITGTGPRYCPSIEDKVARFPTRESHHVFVEPETLTSEEMYPNGISTSLPLDIQKQYIQSIRGFENAVISRPGYAVEYDFVFPEQINHTLETKTIKGLFLAGQINGTTGYEEAAGQGVVAGINAALKANGSNKPFILDRNESYIGVMIDDLVTLGVDEPYRMFTSRAERRLLLRQDNAFTRLANKAYNLGLIDHTLYHDIEQEQQDVKHVLKTLRVTQSPQQLFALAQQTVQNKTMLENILGKKLSDRAIQTINANIRYEPYLKREKKEIEKAQKYKMLEIPVTMTYKNMSGLSTELRQKLTRYQPKTIANAALIPGMTPAALSLLILKSQQHKTN